MTPVPESAASRILLVEDNAADIYLFRQALQLAGLTFELTVIQDGDEALTFAQSDPARCAIGMPDLLVLDLNLPKVGGYQVLEAVRQNPALFHLAVVIVTSSEASRDYEKCAALGVNRYIPKPLELDEFLRIGEIVKKLLAATKSE